MLPPVLASWEGGSLMLPHLIRIWPTHCLCLGHGFPLRSFPCWTKIDWLIWQRSPNWGPRTWWLTMWSTHPAICALNCCYLKSIAFYSITSITRKFSSKSNKIPTGMDSGNPLTLTFICFIQDPVRNRANCFSNQVKWGQDFPLSFSSAFICSGEIKASIQREVGCYKDAACRPIPKQEPTQTREIPP